MSDITQEIVTERLILRAFRLEDAESAFDMVSRNRPRLENDFPKLLSKAQNPEGVKEVIADRTKEWRKSSAFFFAMLKSNPMELIGQLSVKNINWKSGKAELAYFVDQKYARQGYSTEAMHGLIEWCFETLQMNSLFLRAALDNIPSQKLAEKVGFNKQGVVPKDHKRQDGQLVDVYYYTLTPKEYDVWKALLLQN